MRSIATIFCLLLLGNAVFAQSTANLQYYLPDVPYDQKIPTPAQWLGYEVGDWHATHDQLLGYMRALDAASERVTLQTYGRTHENRPLICLTISDPANMARLDAIKSERKKISDPNYKGNLDVSSLPAVYYMGYSIHGNETSGSNAALMVAYYLAAGQSEEVLKNFKNTVILFDPCFNPDGMQRFSSWINSHKSRNNSPDPTGDEYNEPWPRGRTNHYGFDLNRDWLVCRQPESPGRVAIFQDWKPNVLTDHHEMGSNASFFFQPGVPSRTNPITPPKNQQLTSKIAEFHAKMLEEKNVLFYTKENFDDFYYGKGSTYPDIQGGIGILFEQASSRGSAQETENGLLTFQYSIRNQVIASLSTLKAIQDMRQELNEYQREFFKSAIEEAKKSDIKGYIFSDGDVPARELLQLLGSHGVKVHNLTKELQVGEKRFLENHAFVVPSEQAQYRLIRAIFERPMQFKDSIFYDISAWTLPDAFGLEWAPLTAKNLENCATKEGIQLVSLRPPSMIGTDDYYAVAIHPNGYEFPAIVAGLLRTGMRLRLAIESFEIDGTKFDQGTVVVAMDRQPVAKEQIIDALNKALGQGASLQIINKGMSTYGPDLGSDKFPVIRTPKIIMATGEGVNVADAGEIWHLLDTRYDMPITQVETNRMGNVNLSKYNVLILANGSFGSLSAEKVKQFVQDGGTLVATGRSLNWLKQQALAPIEWRKSTQSKPNQRAYSNLVNDKAALAMPGVIFEADLDLSHPLCYGYKNSRLPIFFGGHPIFGASENPYANPIRFTQKPLLAGYVHATVLPLAPGASAATVYGIGRGKVICFPGNPNFRSFWYGTNRLFANAILFGNLIAAESTEKK